MKRITLTVLPHEQMRYPTVGDWQETFTSVHIDVADMGDDDQNFLILLHELVEWYLCKKAQIAPERVDEYDLAHLDDDDPGLNMDAPYHRQHMIAYAMEVLFAGFLNINWKRYEENVSTVFDHVSTHLLKAKVR